MKPSPSPMPSQPSFRLRRGLAGVSLAFAVAFVFVGCKSVPKPGDDCKAVDIRCVDSRTELACQKGTFIAVPCKGPLGCREADQKHLFCDVTGNAEGDPCSTDEEGSAQCLGTTSRITCRGGKLTIDHCRGAAGCRASGRGVECDQSKSEDGDPCSGTTNACSLDGHRVLACSDGHYATAATCPGEAGCSVENGSVECDLGKKAKDKPH